MSALKTQPTQERDSQTLADMGLEPVEDIPSPEQSEPESQPVNETDNEPKEKLGVGIPQFKSLKPVAQVQQPKALVAVTLNSDLKTQTHRIRLFAKDDRFVTQHLLSQENIQRGTHKSKRSEIEYWIYQHNLANPKNPLELEKVLESVEYEND